MPIRLVVTDLDGTLLRDDKSISQRTLAIRDRCRAIGLPFAVATSRSEDAAHRFLQQICPDAVISCGGAKVILHGHTICQRLLTVAQVNDILAHCRAACPEAKMTITADSGYYRNVCGDPDSIDYLHAKYHAMQPFPEPAYKVVAELPEDAFGQVRQILSWCDCISFTGEDWRSFCLKGVHKGTALTCLAGAMGIGLPDVAAFGDDQNDLPMLRIVGHGVAMANAIDAAKQAAQYVTLSNEEDGVAHWLEQHL